MNLRAVELVGPLVVAVTLLPGCSAPQRVRMYEGPELPSENSATVTGSFDRDTMMVTLETVDGAIIPNQGGARGGWASRKTTAVVSPGIHTIEIQFWGKSGRIVASHNIPITFVAEAGHDYEIRQERDPSDTDTTAKVVRTNMLGGCQCWRLYVIDLSGENLVPFRHPGAAPDAELLATPLQELFLLSAVPGFSLWGIDPTFINGEPRADLLAQCPKCSN